MTTSVQVLVGNAPVQVDHFVRDFICRTTAGMLSALRGGEDFQLLELRIEGEDVTVKIDSRPLSIKPFVGTIVRNTVLGMVSSLKGVSDTHLVVVNIRR